MSNQQKFRIIISPFVGGLPLKFGMSPTEVATIIGPPVDVYDDGCQEFRTGAWTKLFYGPQGLKEVDCCDEAEMVFDGVNLFEHPDPIRFLMDRGSHPVTGVGSVIFLEFGIAMPEHPNSPINRSDRSIAVFSTEVRDEYISENRPKWVPVS